MTGPDTGAPGPRPRRRSTRKNTQRFGLLRGPRVGRNILIAMCAIAVAHAGFTFQSLRLGSMFYGLAAIGMPRSEASYLMGKPARVEGTDPVTWLYPNGSAITRVEFDAGRDRAQRVRCADAQLAPFGCPSTLGIAIGTPEDDIWYRLGSPTSQRYVGDTKVITYRDLGLSFYLRKFQTSAIELQGGGGGWGLVRRTLRALLP